MKNKVCFGMTLYNNAKFLREAMDSLLNQSDPDFFIVAVDDCSTDETEVIMREYEVADSRVKYFRNESRLGLIATWRKAFYLSCEMHSPVYYAWVSDHDIWHRDWLKKHVEILNKYINVVLAYPEVVPINADGETIEMKPEVSFETIDMAQIDRLYHLCRHMRGAGSKVYGLFKVNALLKTSIFPHVSMPDRLLLIELGVHGAFKYIPEKLWFRRYYKPVNENENYQDRQNSYLFGSEPIPFHVNFPFISHTLSLVLAMSVYPENNNYSNFLTGILTALLYWEGNRHFIERELGRMHEIINVGPAASIDEFTAAFLSNNQIPEVVKVSMSLMGMKPEKLEAKTVSKILNILMIGMMTHHYARSSIFEEKLRAIKSHTVQFFKESQKMKNENTAIKMKNERLNLELEYWKTEARMSMGDKIKRKMKNILRRLGAKKKENE